MRIYFKNYAPFILILFLSYLLIPPFFHLTLYFTVLITFTLYITPQLYARYSTPVVWIYRTFTSLVLWMGFNFALIPLDLTLSGQTQLISTLLLQVVIQVLLTYYFVYQIQVASNQLNNQLSCMPQMMNRGTVFSSNIVTYFKYASNDILEDTTYSLNQTYWLDVLIADFSEDAIRFYTSLPAWEKHMAPTQTIFYEDIKKITFLIRRKIYTYRYSPSILYVPNIEIMLTDDTVIYLQNDSLSVIQDIFNQVDAHVPIIEDPFQILEVINSSRALQEQHFNKRNKELGYPDFSNTAQPLKKK